MEMPEKLLTLRHAISGDRGLCERLLRFQNVSPEIRRMALQDIAAQMRSADGEAATIEAFQSLSQPRLFEAACHTLREFQSTPKHDPRTPGR